MEMNEVEIARQQACQKPVIRIIRCTSRSWLEKQQKINKSPQRYLYQSDSCGSDSEDDINHSIPTSSSPPLFSNQSTSVQHISKDIINHSNPTSSSPQLFSNQSTSVQCISEDEIYHSNPTRSSSPLFSNQSTSAQCISEDDIDHSLHQTSPSPPLFSNKFTSAQRISLYNPSEEDSQKKQNKLEKVRMQLSKKCRSNLVSNLKSSSNLRARLTKKYRDYNFIRLGKQVKQTCRKKTYSVSKKRAPSNNLSQLSPGLPLVDDGIAMKSDENTDEKKVTPVIPDVIAELPILPVQIENNDDNIKEKKLPMPFSSSVTITPVSGTATKMENSATSPTSKAEIVYSSCAVTAPVEFESTTVVSCAASVTLVPAPLVAPKSRLRVKTPQELGAPLTGQVLLTDTRATKDEGCPRTVASVAPFKIKDSGITKFAHQIEIMKSCVYEMLTSYYRFKLPTRYKKRNELGISMNKLCENFKQILSSNSTDFKFGERILLKVAQKFVIQKEYEQLFPELLLDIYKFKPEMKQIFPLNNMFSVLSKATQLKAGCTINEERSNTGNNRPTRKTSHFVKTPNSVNTTKFPQIRSIVPQVAPPTIQLPTAQPQFTGSQTSMHYGSSTSFSIPIYNQQESHPMNIITQTSSTSSTSPNFGLPGYISHIPSPTTVQQSSSENVDKLDNTNKYSKTRKMLRDFYLSIQ